MAAGAAHERSLSPGGPRLRRREGQRKWSGIPWSFGADVFEFPGLPTLLGTRPRLLWVAPVASVSLCDLSPGGRASGPGTSVGLASRLHGVSSWAEEGPTDTVASQSSKLLVTWPGARGSCLAQTWAGWGSLLSRSGIRGVGSLRWPPNVTTYRPLLPAWRIVLRMDGARVEAGAEKPTWVHSWPLI